MTKNCEPSYSSSASAPSPIRGVDQNRFNRTAALSRLIVSRLSATSLPLHPPPLRFGLCRSWLAPRTVSITFIPQITRRRKKRPTLVAMLRVATPAGTLPRPQPATPFSISDGSVGRRVSIRPSRRRGAEGQAGCTSRRGRKRSPAMDGTHMTPFCSPGSGAKQISPAVIEPR